VTVSPASTRICETFNPSFSGLTNISFAATTTPVRWIVSEKHICFALATVTARSRLAGVSAAKVGEEGKKQAIAVAVAMQAADKNCRL
jgi:hypothetical protein